MRSMAQLLAPLRSLDLERMAGLRPNYPPVAVEIDRGEALLVRLRRSRGKATLETHRVRSLPEGAGGGSPLRPSLGASPEDVAGRLRGLFEATGTRPGRISLILPDNLAKVAILALPERPSSSRQLDEIVRFKLRRAVPFRLEEAVISRQVLGSADGGVSVLVAVMLRPVVEQYERVLEAAGARPGLVDLCTPNLFNLCRARIGQAAAGGRDVALLNAARGYFSLLIVRGDRLIFYRCKSLIAGEEGAVDPDAAIARELQTSLSYYQDKLEGTGFAAVLVRAADRPWEEVSALADRAGLARVEPVDPTASLALPDGVHLDPAVGQRIAPAVGAALGRGR